jgi:NAD(P)-dependent dehydrogenase (short-subunit alcohol dehydrogenase family)
MRLAGQRALITGATSGIGRGIAGAFAREGAAVVLAGRDEVRGARAVAEIVQAGGNAVFLRADLATAAGARQLAEESLALGDVGILVNNAALMAYAATAAMDEATLDAMVETNLKSPFFLMAGLGPLMAERREGKVINITTVAAHLPSPTGAAYGATKAGLELMTKAWATEFGPHGVNVNAIAPGAIQTEGADRIAGGQMDSFVELAVAGRLGSVPDIAEAAVFLASPQAAFIHGITLRVDGGWGSVPGRWPSLESAG